MDFTNDDNDFLGEYLHSTQTSPRSPLTFKKKCQQLTNLKMCFGVNTCASIVSCIIVVCLCISGLVMYTDVSNILIDAKGALIDLNVILPEVHTTMNMLRNLCNTPEFKYYCYPKDTNTSLLTTI
jgi:hypothetical protein